MSVKFISELFPDCSDITNMGSNPCTSIFYNYLFFFAIMDTGHIDTTQLRALLDRDQSANFNGKVINVVHHIPFDCILTTTVDVSNGNTNLDSTAIRRSQRQSSLSLDAAPISQLARRRSSCLVRPSNIGQAGAWKLKRRRGYSAMNAGIKSLDNHYKTLYIGSVGNIVTDHNSGHVPNEQVTQEERDSLRRLLKSEHHIDPIFIDDNLAYGHYEGYCKQGKQTAITRIRAIWMLIFSPQLHSPLAYIALSYLGREYR